MRQLPTVAALAGAVAIISAAGAEDAIDAATFEAVAALATRDYPDPAAATVRNVHKSRAANGHGYCGEVSVPTGDGGFTIFHALLESSIGPSVLRLAEFPESDQSNNAIAVRRMMTNIGCVE